MSKTIRSVVKISKLFEQTGQFLGCLAEKATYLLSFMVKHVASTLVEDVAFCFGKD